MGEGGDFVVVWGSDGSSETDHSGYSIQGRRYASNKATQGGEFQVDSYTAGGSVDPALAELSTGRFRRGVGELRIFWACTERKFAFPLAARVGWPAPDLARVRSVGSTFRPPALRARRWPMRGCWNGGAAASARAILLEAVSLTLLGAHPSAAQVPVAQGPDFQVDSYTTSDQSKPSVAATGNGDFVVVWESDGSPGNDTSYTSIQGQRYASDGTPLGGQFQVNTETSYNQTYPVVATSGNGEFIVVWNSQDSLIGSTGYNVHGRRYASSGAPLGGEFQVNTYTTGDQVSRSVATNAQGDFVVVWTSEGSSGGDTSETSIQGQRYSSSGTAQGGEFQVNSYTSNFQVAPAVAADAAGGFVVVWESRGSSGSDHSGFSVQGQRYASNGAAQGGQFQVNTFVANDQFGPAVATDADGDFVVVWTSLGSSQSDQSGVSVQGQRYASSGAALGSEFQVNTYTTLDQGAASVAVNAAGEIQVVWASRGSSGTDTSFFSIQGQRYDSSGAALGGEFQVNSYTNGDQTYPWVAADALGHFVVTWWSVGSSGSDTSGQSIQARRFESFALGDQFQVNT
ncbi:MAG TPA: hypothetical protein VMS55_06730, partial [Myxococcota bacterium]|nr:hypothetical protein [Myxococcota bacterium]